MQDLPVSVATEGFERQVEVETTLCISSIWTHCLGALGSKSSNLSGLGRGAASDAFSLHDHRLYIRVETVIWCYRNRVKHCDWQLRLTSTWLPCTSTAAICQIKVATLCLEFTIYQNLQILWCEKSEYLTQINENCCRGKKNHKYELCCALLILDTL